MISLSTYFIILFTLQLYLILQEASVEWLQFIWSLLFLVLLFYRQRLYYPQDHPHYIIQKQKIRYVLLLLGLLIISHLYLTGLISENSEIRDRADLKDYIEKEEVIHLTGEVLTLPYIDGNRIRFDLKLTRINGEVIKPSERIRITRYARQEKEITPFKKLKKGDLWMGQATLSIPSVARNPGGFDYKKYLERQSIFRLGTITEPHWVHKPSQGIYYRFINVLDQQRLDWKNQVEAIFTPEIAAIVVAMTVGDRSELNGEILSTYQELGIIHLLAISGLHVGILLWSLYYALIKLRLTREAALWYLMIFIPFYIYLSGASPSVIRAGLMAFIAILCIRLNLWRHSIIAFYIVYMGTLLYNPFWIYSVGYQLSFSVTFVLLIGLPYVQHWLINWPNKLRTLVGVSLLAQLASLPILLYHFHGFSLYSFILNILIVPIFTILFIPGAFIIPLLSYVNESIVMLARNIYQWGLETIHSILHILRELPGSYLVTGQPYVWWMILYIILFIYWFILLEWKKNRQALFTLIAIISLTFSLQLLPYLDSEARITVLDVGQGESIVIELPYREEVLLIDAPGGFLEKEAWKKKKDPFNPGKDIVLPYLHYRGIQELDKVIITHSHYDHYGGINGLLREVKINSIFRSPIPPQSKIEREWLSQVSELEIPVFYLKEGIKWHSKNAFFSSVISTSKRISSWFSGRNS